MSTIEQLSKEYKAKRGIAKGSITRMITYADGISDRTLASDIATRLELLEKSFNDFTECEAKLAIYEVASEMPEYEAKYLNVKAKLTQYLSKPKATQEANTVETMMSRILKDQNEFLTNLSSSFTTSLNQTVTQSLDEPHCSVRLPRLNVPTFSGEYREFPSFKDLYVALVHTKIGLNEAEKFQYLRGYLRGEAADLVKHIPITELNYNQAWKRLCDRYDKPKYVLNSMIKCFIDQPAIQQASLTKLKQLFNNADEVYRGIDALGGLAKHRDPWLIYLMLIKTDPETQQVWANKTVNKEFPSFDDFLKFLSDRCNAFESCESTKQITTRPHVVKSHQLKSTINNTDECLVCKGNHKVHQCDKFKTLTSVDRREQAAKLHMCFNCLSPRHRAINCLSQRNCLKCGRRHHTLLHNDTLSNHTSIGASSMIEVSNEAESSHVNESHSVEPPTPTMSSSTACKDGRTILPTAVVKIKTRLGQFQSSNLLLDSGSQVSFISQRCVNQMGIRCNPGKLRIEGLATSNVTTTGSASFNIYAHFDVTKYLTINAYVLPKITTLPACLEGAVEQLSRHSPELLLADPYFFKQREIDILLGADYFFHVLQSNQVQTVSNMIARETLFGYVIAGMVDQSEFNDKLENRKTCHINVVDEQPLEEILRKFWEQEEVLETKVWTEEEEACENHFKRTYRRNQDGRYIVQLPLRNNTLQLGESYKVAFQRLLSMERKFSRNLEFKDLYHKFIEEYLSLGHMRIVPENQRNQHDREIYYLPHHGVLKENSSTTKLRVVFDGSAVTSNGKSLNNNLMVGPVQQDTLWAILLRFRRFEIAIVADIAKMYRQILIDPNQTSLQRILWRNSPSDEVRQYELLTVTYGTSAAPFLAVRVLHQLAEDCRIGHPAVSEVIKKNFYVDDLLTGAETEAQAERLKNEISLVLAEGGFCLRKWQSNVPRFRDTNELTQITEDGRMSSTLGLYWDSISDEFRFKIVDVPYVSCTKRTVLSIAARIFDPLGWLLPFTVKVKVFMQTLWIKKVTWDEMLPPDLQSMWRKMHEQFPLLNSVTTSRCIGSMSGELQLHGFSDSSELAYAAAIYVRVKKGEQYVMSLITAKSKVAPIKQISLPKLELCGAHLLAKLMHKVLVAYELQTNLPVWLWTDSTIVLAWLSNHPRRWKSYVANRVSAIHTLLPQASWRHVRGTENPADLATRGIKASELIDNELWFKGPKWLSSREETWPIQPTINQTLQETRIKELHMFHTLVKNDKTHPVALLLTRISKWTHLIRTMAYVLRFVNNTTSKTKWTAGIKPSELESAEIMIIRYVQQTEFIEDIHSLTKSKMVPFSSKLSSLAPFIDTQNVLRVGGRLENSHCTYNTKHPMLLPRDHQVTTMILLYLHQYYLHPGPTLLTALSRHKYWILGVREKCRKLCHDCVICFRHSSLRSQQQMGHLPTARVTPSRPFSAVGIDYAGPILLSTKKGRGAKLIKGFIAVFVCFATKALHIETSSDLTTDAFLAALDRFVARRGAPTEIYSDNGSNFLGAKRQLHEHYKLLHTKECQSRINDYATSKGITWRLIPPISPHFGGIWERAVRSVKTHLIKVIKNAHLTYEEMETVLVQIEGILNSRPLCAIKNEDGCNIDALTPGHFLTLGPITALPHADYEEVKMSRLSRWEKVQSLVQSFWRRYSITYLNTLQQRSKWQHKNSNIKKDDVVLLHDNHSAPCTWPLGRVIEVHPGKDGLIRVATVQTKSTKYKRPIVKLFRLPLED